MNPLTEAREHVAGLLTGLDVPVHREPPETPSGTCVVVGAGTPWARPGLAAGSTAVRVAVTVMVPIQGGRTLLGRVEQLAWAVIGAVGAGNVEPGQPYVDELGRAKYGTGDYYTATVTFTIHVCH